jgi:hypothetical protein
MICEFGEILLIVARLSFTEICKLQISFKSGSDEGFSQLEHRLRRKDDPHPLRLCAFA